MTVDGGLGFDSGEESSARTHARMRTLRTHSGLQGNESRTGAADAGIPADAAPGKPSLTCNPGYAIPMPEILP
eukprot:10056626-Alexandrium_andersonii.AAC.1